MAHVTASIKPRILAVKLADFGDALLTTPALRILRRGLPEAHIDVLTTAIGAVAYRHSGLVDEVMTFEKSAYDRPAAGLRRPFAPLRLGRELRERRYDGVALFHSLTTRYGAAKHAALTLSTGAPIRAGRARPGGRRGWFLTHAAPDLGYDRAHVVESDLAVAVALLAALGLSPEAIAAADSPGERRLAFTPGPEAEAAADALLAEIMAGSRQVEIPADAPRTDSPAARPLVAVHPGTGAYSPARRWTPEGFAAVIDGLIQDGARVVIVGTKADGTGEVFKRCRVPGAVLDLTGRTDLPTLGAVLARMDLVVGNDSGVTHLAVAMGAPVVAVFGPSNPVAWGPWWPGVDAAGHPAASLHRVVALDLPCRPCFYVGHRLGSPQGCPTRDCLAWLPPARVLAAAREVLGEGKPTVSFEP
jgi:ADP-heptose:LPS heptosyltransferase